MDTRNLKKISFCGLILIVCMLFVTGCFGKKASQTLYKVGEKATIDSYEITCTSYEVIENFLMVQFHISNTSDKEQTITLKEAFEYSVKGKDEKAAENVSEGDVILSAGDSVDTTVIYDISGSTAENADSHKIVFYSGVASNNIAFQLEETKEEEK